MAFSQLCVQCVSFVDETLGRCCFIFIEIALMEAGEEEWVGQTGRDLDPDSSSDNINSFNIYLYVKKQYSHWADTPLPASMERCVGKALFGSYSVEKKKNISPLPAHPAVFTLNKNMRAPTPMHAT